LDSYTLMIECDGQDAGLLQLRPDTSLESERGFEVSILLAPSNQGRGVGKAALLLARNLLPGVSLFATISDENARSISAFQASGYRKIGRERFANPRPAQ
jgi:RimJ/RimL family protein N-acetyltransferase